MKKNIFKRGFTLIELLVVIAIIGILASVVLASLNSARDKGSDATIKSTLNNMRAQAELYYDSNSNSYTGMCESEAVSNATSNVDAMNGIGVVLCVDGDDVSNAWAMHAQLVGDTAEFYCADFQGLSTITDGSTISATDATCD